MTADLPPTWKVPAQEVRSCYELEGNDGQSLVKQFGQVISHWQSRPSYAIDFQSSLLDEVNHIPFKKVGTIKVRFKQALPMRPRKLGVEGYEEE